MRPTVSVLALGGTISSMPAHAGAPARMSLAAPDLVARLGEIDVDLRPETVGIEPSANLRLCDIVDLAGRIDALTGEGVHGCVVTQGTDTLEECAFLLDHLITTAAPVVVTGAMRPTGSPGADGEANLLASIRVAAADAARDLGVLVVMNDEIHLARFVRKVSASSLVAFASAPVGPVGWVAGGRVRIPLLPRQRRSAVRLPSSPVTLPPVALVRLGFDATADVIDLVTTEAFAGAVVEVYGAGHVPRDLLEPLKRLADAMPLVFASRVSVGELHASGCDFEGDEASLLALGAIPAVALDGLKARLLLALALGAGEDRDRIAAWFREEAL